MVRCRVSAKWFGTIKDLEARKDLQLVDVDTDVEAVKEQFGNRPAIKDFDGFFVKVGEGEYDEVFGFHGTIPELHKDVFRIRMVCK